MKDLNMVKTRAMAPALTALMLAATLVLGVVGCGDNARNKALNQSLTALNTARDGFVVWDDGHQTQIVDRAEAFDAGNAALQAYYQQRAPVLAGFEAAYRLLAIAAFDPTAANALKVYVQLLELWDLLKQLTGAAPAAPPEAK